jgi:hypothetical protein
MSNSFEQMKTDIKTLQEEVRRIKGDDPVAMRQRILRLEQEVRRLKEVQK